MESLTTDIDAALANLDRAFAGRWTHFDPGGCDRCYSASELAALRTGAHVTDETLLCVFGGWHHCWTDLPGLVHRLAPRFLRLLVSDRVHSVRQEDAGDLFWDAGWKAWPQRDAVQGVLQAWWRATGSFSTLEFLVPASHEVLPWLRELENSSEALPDLIEQTFFDLASRDLKLGHYAAAVEMTGWLLEHGVALLAEAAGPGVESALQRLADLELCTQS